MEIRNFSCCVQKSSFVRCVHSIVTLKNKFRISARPCNILYMYIFNVPDRQTFMAYKPPKKIAVQTKISGKKFSRIFFLFYLLSTVKISFHRVRFVNFVFLTHPHFFKALISTLSSCGHGFAVLFYNDD